MSIQVVSNVYSAGFTSTILPSIFSMETGFSGSMNSPMLLASTSVEPIRTLPIGASLEQVFTTSPTFTSSPDNRSTFPAMSVFSAIFSSVLPRRKTTIHIAAITMAAHNVICPANGDMYTYAIVTDAAKLRKPKIPANPIPGIKKISATTRATPKTNRSATRKVYRFILFLGQSYCFFFKNTRK